METFNVWDKVSVTLDDGKKYAGMILSYDDDADPVIYAVSIIQTQVVVFGTQSDLTITAIS